MWLKGAGNFRSRWNELLLSDDHLETSAIQLALIEMVIGNVSSMAPKQMSLKSELFPYLQYLDLYPGNAYWHRNAFAGKFIGKITGSVSNETGRNVKLEEGLMNVW